MPENRTVVYRGGSREDAEQAYHADARGGAAAGYVPTSEDWTTALGQQVLTVVYAYLPDQAIGVAAALAAAEVETALRAQAPIAPGVAAQAPTPTVSPGATAAASPSRLVSVVVVLVVIAVVVAALIGTGVIKLGAGPSGAAAPPAGTIWFGSSFDPSTFAISGKTTSVSAGTTVAYVGHLTRSIGTGQANLRISVNGQTDRQSGAKSPGLG